MQVINLFVVYSLSATDRSYTIQTVTMSGGIDPDTYDDIFLTMYDNDGNACAETQLWHDQLPFQEGAWVSF